ncbi:hypothetical protein L3X38_025084 [Prunus dulcis]|uniref:Uncharacterized protein n=1 Tax=Prunus dulcis TaxID=3755 RepID=A0AAD4W3K1_PRUDU|nr:hypothetical protein L3X38_025084 [Prunus dulcis]
MAVDWESEELSEDEEGQLEVIRALPPTMGIDRNDPKARQLLERLLKKGTIASVSGRRVPPQTHARNEVVAPIVPVGQVEQYGMVRRFMIYHEKEVEKCNA